MLRVLAAAEVMHNDAVGISGERTVEKCRRLKQAAKKAQAFH
jgi:hypothetical protein